MERMAAEAEAPPRNASVGLLVEGKDENLIRDSQILDLMNSREQPLIQRNAERAASDDRRTHSCSKTSCYARVFGVQ